MEEREERQLGTTNIFVNPVGLGCMGFSHAYGTAVEKSEAVKTIRSAYDVGYNFFDTAECYLGVNSDGSISNNEDYLRRANKICTVTVIQNRYSMAARWHENIFPVCEELKISFVAFSPLANGLFAGTYQNKKIEDNDYRKKMPQFTLYEILKKFRRYGQKRKDI